MHIGNQSIKLDIPVSISECNCIVGPKEKEGPLGEYFENYTKDIFFGEKTWEKAETKFIKENYSCIVDKISSFKNNKIDYIIGGDLLNQCIASSFAYRNTNIPYIGIYNACSTFVEGMSIAALFISSDNANNCLVSTSSHFCSAEKQFRYPLSLGTQKTQYAQWTVTAAGAAVLNKNGLGPYITNITNGKIIDLGIKDVSNMGSCMAPAAADTIYNHLRDTNRDVSYYDAIITGDLGYRGSDVLIDLLKQNNLDISDKHFDCGKLIFLNEKQDTHSGGSGCGCIAAVFSAYIFKKLKERQWNKILLVATGALMSPISSWQGESIPGIAHAVSIENEVC